MIFGAVCVHAKEPRLCDNASLLSASQREELQNALDSTSEKHNVDIVIVTTNSTLSKSAESYADDYYDSNGYSKDGILLLISMEEREWHISTSGSCIKAFSDSGLDYMADRFVVYLSEDNYGRAFSAFTELCDDFLTQAESGDPYDRHNLPKDPFDVTTSIVFSLIVGVIVAIIATSIMKGQLNTVHSKTRAQEYVVPGTLNIRRSRDFFLYRTINRRPRPKDTGSSTHRSSSGRSHGGGGGRF